MLVLIGDEHDEQIGHRVLLAEGGDLAGVEQVRGFDPMTRISTPTRGRPVESSRTVPVSTVWARSADE